MSTTQILFYVPVRRTLFNLVLLMPLLVNGETFAHAGQTGAALLRLSDGYYVQFSNGSWCAVKGDGEGKEWVKVMGLPRGGIC
jgi:hypothetical protein